MFRDIGNYKVQFLSIFLMAFIGVTVYTGLTAENIGLEDSINSYYEDTNFADGWIYSNYLFDDALYQVYMLGATTDMERQLVVDSQATLKNQPHVTLHFVENNTISKFYLLEGKELDINDSDGVWLDKSFADARHLKIGDSITFKSNGIQITKEIRGLGYSPEYIYNSPPSAAAPDYYQNGFAYLSHKAFPSDNITYNVLNVKFDGTPETFSKLLAYRLDGYYTSFIPQSGQYSATIVEDTLQQMESVSAIYPFVFISISMLILLTTTKRIISHQRVQIGVLKANGFKNDTIARHYILSGFLTATAGSALGALAGPPLLHFIVNPIRSHFYKYPYWNFYGFEHFILLIALIGLVSIIVSYYSIKNIINEPASQIIKQKAPNLSSSSIEKSRFLKKLSFNFRWNYRDAKRNKFRAAMTIIGVIGCAVLLISGFGVYEDMEISKDWHFNEVNHFESKLIVDDNADLSQINEVAKKVNGDEIMESYIEVTHDDTKFGSLLILDGTDLITITDDNHNKMELGNNEVSISKKMAQELGVHVGDTINCKIVESNENFKVKIDKIHSSPFSQGIVMSADKLKETGLNYTPTSIITSEHVNGTYDGIKSITYKEDMIDGWDQMQKSTIIIITSLIFFAIVLAAIILYNLNLLSFIEMENDIATLKILGFKSRYLTRLLMTQSLTYVIIGFILGIPIGFYILTVLLSSFGNKLYIIPSISPFYLVITLIIILIVSISVNLYFSVKIRKMDMVESLKGFE